MEFIGTQPIYLQIGDYICENILLEKWESGEKIPSIRDLAVMTEVNPNTIMRTYNYLQDRGIIVNQRGIGYFVAEDGSRRTKEMKKKDFIEKELPRFFKNLDLLEMSLDELKNLYKEYKETAAKEENV